MFRRFSYSLFTLVLAGAVFASYAVADNPGPGYEVFGATYPTVLSPGGEGILHFEVYDVGGAEGTEGLTLTDTLPAGLERSGGGCSGSTVVTCHLYAIEEFGGLPGEEENILVRVAADAQYAYPHRPRDFDWWWRAECDGDDCIGALWDRTVWTGDLKLGCVGFKF